jgi:NAD-dependent dihydropyrimidine dehydrogenase PreA subunit
MPGKSGISFPRFEPDTNWRRVTEFQGTAVDYLKELMWGLDLAYMPFVNPEKCNGCCECVTICPTDVFALRDGRARVINAKECVGCENCVEVCEAKAISVMEVRPKPSEFRHEF